MRRVGLNETFHGTAAGQMPASQALEAKFGLTERQAQCAALLRAGMPIPSLAEVLGISASTLESHLSELRRALGCGSTEQLRADLDSMISDEELAAFRCWPSGTNASLEVSEAHRSLAARLRNCVSVEQALDALRESLSALEVLHVYYCFVPHSVQGFLRGDVVDVFLAPQEVKTAFDGSGGLATQPIAQRLFEAPTDVPVLPLGMNDSPPSLSEFNQICRDHGATHIAGIGFPSGPGFVGLAFTLRASSFDAENKINDEGEAIRAQCLMMHAALLTNGALAAKLRLTVKERNALSGIALGKRISELATEMGVSERGLTKLLASARTKLRARTNTEAAVKASLVNALVFL